MVEGIPVQIIPAAVARSDQVRFDENPWPRGCPDHRVEREGWLSIADDLGRYGRDRFPGVDPLDDDGLAVATGGEPP